MLLVLYSNTEIVIHLLSPLQMRRAGHRQSKQLAQGHTAVRKHIRVCRSLCTHTAPRICIEVYLQ